MLNKSDFPCETCGYTYEDALIHGDHHLCKSKQKQNCTQCETLKVEVERLKEIIKETFVNNLHIFCPSCKEKDCLCMLDCTCEKLRNILDGKK